MERAALESNYAQSLLKLAQYGAARLELFRGLVILLTSDAFLQKCKG